MTNFIAYLLCFLFVLSSPIEAQASGEATLIEREKAKPRETDVLRGSLDFQGQYFEEGQQGRLKVKFLTPRGAAEKAGLLENDVVLAFNGAGFRFLDDLERVEHFDGLLPGDQVEVQILRAEENLTLVVVASKLTPDQIQRIEEFRAEAKFRRQYRILDQTGRGDGLVLDVHREPVSGLLVYSAPSYPTAMFQHMQVYVDTIPPLRDSLSKIPPGGHWGLEVLKTGTRLDLNVLVDRVSPDREKNP